MQWSSYLSEYTGESALAWLERNNSQKQWEDFFGAFTLSVFFYILHTLSEPKEGKEVLNAYFLFRGGWLDRMEGRTNCKIKVQSLPTCMHKIYKNLIWFLSTRVWSLSALVTNSLTNWCWWDLTYVTLAFDDANSKVLGVFVFLLLMLNNVLTTIWSIFWSWCLVEILNRYFRQDI